ncbi:MAG: carboxyl transferase domain-containing protein [Pseudomonadota bacterium]|nr:carboxyl transferase domain-containing protein [Pseudomonadota bacterium]
MAFVPLRPIGTPLPAPPASAARNAAREATLAAAQAEVRAGWGPQAAARVREKGKLPTWDRIERLVDPGTEVLPVGSYVNWGRDFRGSKRRAPGAGVVTAWCTVEGRRVIVIANDNTVASGSWWPLSPEKIERAQQMALDLRVPVVYLVDCSGLFLPEQALSFPGRTGAGHIFKKNSLLAAGGVPQIAGVFGDCIAGGGYMPIISDRVYMTESAYMVIAGAALIKGAKSQHLTSLDIGGPEVHVHQSGCADVRVPDDETALAMIRREIARLPTSAAPFYRHGAEAAPPRFDPAEIAAILPDDHRQVYDMREILARLVDDSLFCEVMADRGAEMITGVGRVAGLWCGFIANNLLPTPHPDQPGRVRGGGILYREGIAKISAFSRSCNTDGLPIVWLQDIAGFDIGIEAEAQGLLGYGSSLIYTNSTNKVPMVTVLLRKASGAGYYAMAGMPYDPVLQLSTPLTRLAVMEGRTLAIAAFNTKLDDNFEIASADPEERAAIAAQMDETAARIETDMDPMAAAARMDTDEVVPFAALRDYLVAAVEMAWQSPRPARNPRIWSLHDLAVLTRVRTSSAAEEHAAAALVVEAPIDGLVPVRVATDGTFWRRPSPRDPVFLEVGVVVDATTPVGLIEVMKTFAPVRSGVAGVLERFALTDGTPVAAGTVVAWVRPG